MKRLSYITIPILLLLISCQGDPSEKSGFVYDPHVSYPLFAPGDFWPDKFDQRGLQNAILYRNKIYCNTIDPAGDGNFFYCLNPENGLVVWRAHVQAYASQPASFLGDTVVYCSYLGNIAAFDPKGEPVWDARLGHTYGGHWVDTIRSALLVKTVYGPWVSVYDIRSGRLISEEKNDSLQRLVEIKTEEGQTMKKQVYRFTRAGFVYLIKCIPGEKGGYKIEISK